MIEYDSMEIARQQCVAFMAGEKKWKKNAPKGKKYCGYKFKTKADKSGISFTPYPVYIRKARNK